MKSLGIPMILLIIFIFPSPIDSGPTGNSERSPAHRSQTGQKNVGPTLGLSPRVLSRPEKRGFRREANQKLSEG